MPEKVPPKFGSDILYRSGVIAIVHRGGGGGGGGV